MLQLLCYNVDLDRLECKTMFELYSSPELIHFNLLELVNRLWSVLGWFCMVWFVIYYDKISLKLFTLPETVEKFVVQDAHIFWSHTHCITQAIWCLTQLFSLKSS